MEEQIDFKAVRIDLDGRYIVVLETQTNLTAGAIERIERISGKLNGAMTDTTPAGLRRMKLQCGSFEGRTLPMGWLGRALASKHSPSAT